MNPVAYGQANGIFTSPLSQELLFMSDKSDKQVATLLDSLIYDLTVTVLNIQNRKREYR